MAQNARSVPGSISAWKNWKPVTPCSVARPAAASIELFSAEGLLNPANSLGCARIRS